MAYDLAFRTQIPRTFSRGDGTTAAAAGGIGILAAGLCLLVPRLRRRSEIAKARRDYSHDYYDGLPAVRLHRTVEMPAISMSDLVKQPRR